MPASDIQDGWWIVRKYNCMGCHQFTPDQSTVLMGMKHYQDIQEQLPPKLLTEGRARRSRVAAAIPVQSGAEHNRHQPQRGAAIPASAHADVLLLR